MPAAILTRTELDNERTAGALRSLGIEVWSVPMIEHREIAYDAESLEQFGAHARDGVVLITSAHAASLWLRSRNGPLAGFTPSSYVVVGARSATLLREHDAAVPVEAIAPSVEALPGTLPAGISSLLYPCSAIRRDAGIEALRSLGIVVHEMPLYRPVMPVDARSRLLEALDRASRPRAIVFFSPSAVANWFSLRSDIPSDSIFVAIGPTTAESLRAHRVEEVATADEADIAVLAAVVAERLRRGA